MSTTSVVSEMLPIKPPRQAKIRERIPKVTAEVIMKVLEGVAYKKGEGLTLIDAARYANVSEVYARRALESLVQLGAVTHLDDRFLAEPETDDITRASREQWPLLFRKFLQRFQPFILFIMLLGKGDSPDDSARKIKVISDIHETADVIRSSLLNWGQYGGILHYSKGKIQLKVPTDRLSAEYIRELIQALEDDMRARVFIANKLSEEIFGYMQRDEIDFLVSAIRKHQEDQRKSIEDAGRALEDFLRRVADEKNVDVSRSVGIGQVADALKGANVIHSRHLEMCDFVNGMRIAAAHSKEAATLQSWTIKPDSAIETALTTLTTIRSIFQFAFRNNTIV